MSFNPNIPVVTNPTLQSGKQIRANFVSIGKAFSENHGSLISSAGISGKHTVLSMQPLPAPFTDPSTGTTQVALYNKLVATIPELFFRPSNSQTPIQLTYPSLNTAVGVDNYSFIAGPFVVYTGIVVMTVNLQLVTLLPATTLKYVGLSLSSDGVNPRQVSATNIVANTFQIKGVFGTTGNRTIAYVAIGL